VTNSRFQIKGGERFHHVLYMAQANARRVGQGGVAQQPGDDGPPAQAQAPATAAAAAARQVANGAGPVANPVIANMAGVLPHPLPEHPRFDIGAAVLRPPLPTRSDIRYYIHPKIN